MTDAPTWEAVLDEFERKIVSGETSLNEGTPFEPFVLEPFVAPTDLGRIPEDLVDRAVRLLTLNTELEQRMLTAVETLQRQIGKSNEGSRPGRRSHFAEASIPRYFDEAI